MRNAISLLRGICGLLIRGGLGTSGSRLGSRHSLRYRCASLRLMTAGALIAAIGCVRSPPDSGPRLSRSDNHGVRSLTWISRAVHIVSGKIALPPGGENRWVSDSIELWDVGGLFVVARIDSAAQAKFQAGCDDVVLDCARILDVSAWSVTPGDPSLVKIEVGRLRSRHGGERSLAVGWWKLSPNRWLNVGVLASDRASAASVVYSLRLIPAEK